MEKQLLFMMRKRSWKVPLHNLEGIVSFGYRGTSPALMGACADRNISLCYLTPQGKFLARVTGKTCGNVILRDRQYTSSKDEKRSLEISKNCISGKVTQVSNDRTSVSSIKNVFFITSVLNG